MSSNIIIKPEDGKMCAFFDNGHKVATLGYDESWGNWQMTELHGRPSGAWLIDLGQRMQSLDKEFSR
jgi:hypothetical protein